MGSNRKTQAVWTMGYKGRAIVIFSAFVLAGHPVIPYVRAAAPEAKDDIVPVVELRFQSGNISGLVVEQPVGNVLDWFQRERGVAYYIRPKLRGHLVSGKFANTSEHDVFRKLLKHFDYAIGYASDGRVAKVTITGLRDKVTLSGLREKTSPPRPEKQVDARPLRREADAIPSYDQIQIIEPAPGVELTEEERRAFASAMQEGMAEEELNFQVLQEAYDETGFPVADPGDDTEWPGQFSGQEDSADPFEIDRINSEAGNVDEGPPPPEFEQALNRMPSDQDPPGGD